MLSQDISKILVDENTLQQRVQELGKEIAADYEGKNPLVIGILRGAIFFLTDLVRAMDIPLDIDFMDVSSYGSGVTSSGQVKIVKDLDTSLEGRHVIVVEDIVDTGRTLAHLIELFEMRRAASIRIVSLLDKPERRVKAVEVDYIGITVPNEFVVGYGLDYDQKYRNLPYIGVLNPAIYTEPAE